MKTLPLSFSEKQKKRYSALVEKFSQAKIISVGDLILDEFIWGTVKRISPEAPVPVVNVNRESFMPGGSLNVANNIRTLGATVFPCGIVGRDIRGRMLLKMLRKEGIDSQGIIYDEHRPTTLKTRVIAHAQQVVRFDRENAAPLTKKQLAQIMSFITKKIKDVDGIIIEDYGKGVIVPELVKKIITTAKKLGKFILVDPKEDHILYYKGVTSITPNLKEACGACGITNGDNVNVVDVGKKLLKKLQLESVLLTLSEQGMMLFEKNGDITKIPTAAQEVFDVSGAGDTVIGVFSLALAVGGDLKEASMLANLAAGIVVGKVGTAVVGQAELLEAISKA